MNDIATFIYLHIVTVNIVLANIFISSWQYSSCSLKFVTDAVDCVDRYSISGGWGGGGGENRTKVSIARARYLGAWLHGYFYVMVPYLLLS